jgi:hypothetical protein
MERKRIPPKVAVDIGSGFGVGVASGEGEGEIFTSGVGVGDGVGVTVAVGLISFCANKGVQANSKRLNDKNGRNKRITGKSSVNNLLVDLKTIQGRNHHIFK